MFLERAGQLVDVDPALRSSAQDRIRTVIVLSAALPRDSRRGGRLPADLHFNKMPKTFNLKGPNAS